MIDKRLNEDRVDLKLMIVLFKAHQSLVEFIKDDIKDCNLDLNEFSVLEVIYHKKELTVQEINEKVLVASSSLSYILQKLEKRNLIQRKKCQRDKRVSYISLTDDGYSFSNDLFPKHYDNLKEMFKVLSSEEKESAKEILKKLGYFIKGNIGDNK